jgi:AP2-associated kinase
MYQPKPYVSSTSQPYTSPPPPVPPYRASPVYAAPTQPYNTFTPTQPGVPYSQMPNAQTPRYQQYPPQHRAPPNRYASPNQYANGSYPQQQQQASHPPSQQPATPATRHKGTLAPGQLIRVGDQTVKIERYLSEGGYAHVYLTSSERPVYPPSASDGAKRGRWGEKGYTEHCLKRIAFEDEGVWVDVKKEIETMVSA